MKNTLLSLLAILLACVSFGQIDQAHRVLNCVPDNCYSLQMIDFKRLSQEMEIPQLNADKVLNPLVKANKNYKVLQYLLSSWANQDDKLGIDFTAVAAIYSNGVKGSNVLIPLNNEKRFEAALKKISKDVSFSTAKDGNSSYRVHADNGMVIVCTNDVAYIQTIPFLGRFVAPEGMKIKHSKEQVVNDFRQACNSKFLERPSVKLWLERGMDAYVCGLENQQMLQVNEMLSKLGINAPAYDFGANNVLAFSKMKVEKDGLFYVTELLDENGNPMNSMDLGQLKRSDEGLEALLPYLYENRFYTLFCNVEGFGDYFKEYVDEKQPWSAVLPLLNHPIVGSMATEGDAMLAVTKVDQPKLVGECLQQYVEKNNAKLEEERAEVIEESVEEVTVDEIPEDEKTETMVAAGIAAAKEVERTDTFEDVEVGKLSLVYKQIDGMDGYCILKETYDIDYETFDFKKAYDTIYFVVKDDLLFWMSDLSGVDAIRHPQTDSRNVADLDAKQLLYANVDLKMIGNVAGAETDLGMPPAKNFYVTVKENKLNFGMNAYEGLQHGLLYEMTKYFVNILLIIEQSEFFD